MSLTLDSGEQVPPHSDKSHELHGVEQTPTNDWGILPPPHPPYHQAAALPTTTAYLPAAYPFYGGYSHAAIWPVAPTRQRPAIIGIYGREERRQRLLRFHEKRKRRVWDREGNVYKCRKDFAKSRKRVQGRFIGKDEPAEKPQEEA